MDYTVHGVAKSWIRLTFTFTAFKTVHQLPETSAQGTWVDLINAFSIKHSCSQNALRG